jgi:hypothetical protein
MRAAYAVESSTRMLSIPNGAGVVGRDEVVVTGTVGGGEVVTTEAVGTGEVVTTGAVGGGGARGDR